MWINTQKGSVWGSDRSDARLEVINHQPRYVSRQEQPVYIMRRLKNNKLTACQQHPHIDRLVGKCRTLRWNQVMIINMTWKVRNININLQSRPSRTLPDPLIRDTAASGFHALALATLRTLAEFWQCCHIKESSGLCTSYIWTRHLFFRSCKPIRNGFRQRKTHQKLTQKNWS